MKQYGLKLAIISAIFSAFYHVMDNATMHYFIALPNDVTAALCYLTFGGWMSLLVALPLNPIFGRWIDDKFRKFVIPKRAVQKDACIAGCSITLSSFCYIWASRLTDPSVIVALSQVTLLYTVLQEIRKKTIRWQDIVMSGLLATVGSVMASFDISWRTNVLACFLIIIPSNICWAVAEFAEQRGAKALDSVNFFFWRGVWLAGSASLMVAIIAALTKNFKEIETGWGQLMNGTWWIVLTMVFVWASISLRMTGKQHISVSETMIVTSSQVMIAYPLTWLGNSIMPGVFGHSHELPAIIWIIRILGGCLIIGSVWILFRQIGKVKKEVVETTF